MNSAINISLATNIITVILITYVMSVLYKTKVFSEFYACYTMEKYQTRKITGFILDIVDIT